MPLTTEMIDALYAKRRMKGIYAEKLTAFIASGDQGVSVRDEWPTDFKWDDTQEDGKKGKLASTLKQGFENVKAKSGAPAGSQYVDVMVDGENVFLVNKTLLEGFEPEAETEETEES